MAFKDTLSHLRSISSKILLDYCVGLEKEALRVDQHGYLSQIKHPKALGAPLTHPSISTDFSESQLELITPVFSDIKQATTYLSHLQKHVSARLKDELLWPLSMPCLLDDHIPIANYGSSTTAMEKHIYREGLSLRYGKKMQLISGVHVNFSFGQKLLKKLYNLKKSTLELKEFKNELYFHLCQNFLSESWFLSHLFGASPTFDKSYANLEDIKAYEGFATSLRMSPFGYCNKTKCPQKISFNSFDQYLSSLEHAINSPCKNFQKLGLIRNGKRVQLNANSLQIENEHYERIRPKPQNNTLTPLEALKQFGIEYLEIRSIDLNPYSPIGIEENQLHFLYLFFLYCALKENICQTELENSWDNQNLVSLEGLKPNLLLKTAKGPIPAQNWAKSIFKDLFALAKVLDKSQCKTSYEKIVEDQFKKIKDVKLCPAHLIALEKSHIELGLKLAKKHLSNLQQVNAIKKFDQELTKASKQSLIDLEELEDYQSKHLKGFEDLEQSTQLLIRTAFKQGINIKVLNRLENLIELEKDGQVELVKQATITRFDSYLTYHLLSNKHDTKTILSKTNINVPKSFYTDDKKQALLLAEHLTSDLVALKPSRANFGDGISFVRRSDKLGLKKAIDNAFKCDTHILIEEFIEGFEYRFLVINNKLVGVLRREPANVIGDGTASITELIKRKNQDKAFPKPLKEHIKPGPVEKAFLRAQGLDFQSILKKGQKIYLRRNSNVSTGGDAIECTKDIPKYFKNLAIEATKAIEAKICGIDMIIPNLKAKKYFILELNYNPNIAMHYYPYKGTPINPAIDVLKLLKLSG